MSCASRRSAAFAAVANAALTPPTHARVVSPWARWGALLLVGATVFAGCCCHNVSATDIDGAFNPAVHCSGTSACLSDEIDNASAVYCDGLSACNSIDIGKAGYLECVSTFNYACYLASVGEIGPHFTNLSCVGPYACKSANIGALVGSDVGVITCQGYDACLNLVVDDVQGLQGGLELECLGCVRCRRWC